MASLQRLLSAYALLRLGTSSNFDVKHAIIYEIPGKGARSSYFGTSVAIRPPFDHSLQNAWTIQIGAPRGNADGLNVREPGAVYRCHTYGPCRAFSLDGTANGFGGKGTRAYKEKKDGAWIGVSMDVEGGKSVVCGHRWANQNLKNPENIDVTYLMTGVCYLQEVVNDTWEAPVEKLLPLVDVDKIYTPKPYSVDVSAYHWGLGQAGISVKLAGKPSSFIVGAPGVTHWIGSVIRYGPHLRTSLADFAKTEISRKNKYTYIGYSVAAGKFYKDDELWFVAGAPRSANYRGQVITFRYQDSSDGVLIRSTSVGATFGEYFGAALATSDVDGDGADDLIVGAPLYSDREPDQGRIYLFSASDQGNFLREHQIINGKVGRGRFGSCVASVGDINGDGYGDVAVGAPYQDDRRGAVYVYHGRSSGLEPEHCQRIRAQDISPHLRGFGIAISAPADIDGNKFEDVAVGSYLSDHVVLLRARPVVVLHPNIKTDNFQLIDRRASFFNISFCSGYAGPNAPNYTDVLRIVEVDPLHKRASLEKSNAPFSKKLVRLQSNKIFCETLTFYLNVSGENYSPLQIILKNELPSCSKSARAPMMISSEKTEGADGFLKWCPTGQHAETSREIAFAGICGPDHVCRSDLQLSCRISELESNSYTLGSSNHLVLSMEIKNSGEPAQNAKIKIWSNVKIIKERKQNVKSPASSSNTHWLDVDATLTDSHSSNFTFRIPLEEVKEERELILISDVFTSSTDLNMNNNKCRFSVKLQSDASLRLYSSSSPSTFFISKKTKSANILNFTHVYEVQRTGVTPIKDLEITLYVPFYFRKDFLIFEVETSDWLHTSAPFDEFVIDENGHPSTNTSFPTGENCPPTNRTIFLNCSTPENKCHTLKFHIADGIPTGSSSYVKLLIHLNVSAIDSVKGEKDIAYFSTFAIVRHWEYLKREAGQVEGRASVGVYDEERPPAGGADALLVGLSILTGAFFLSCIVTCLARKNFFTRSKKQELKALKEADASFVYCGPGLATPAS